MTGDTVLIKVCECVKKSIRSGDLLGRMGGDDSRYSFPARAMNVHWK